MKTLIQKICILTLLLIVGQVGQAQIFALGIKGGMTTGSAKFEGVDDRFVDGINSGNVLGYEVGVLGRLKLGPLYARPELLYNFTSGDAGYTTTTSGSESSQTTHYTINRIQIPVMFGFNVIGPLLAIEAGPMYSYMISGTNNYGGLDVNFNRAALGYRAGLASKIGPLQLSVSYQGLQSSSGSGKVHFNQPSALVFGAGFLFGATDD